MEGSSGTAGFADPVDTNCSLSGRNGVAVFGIQVGRQFIQNGRPHPHAAGKVTVLRDGDKMAETQAFFKTK